MKNNVKQLLREGLSKINLNEFFDTTIDSDVKALSKKYVGRMVTWYGDVDQMIVIHKDDIHGMWGNIYDTTKLNFVTKLLRDRYDMGEPNVEFECSYGIGGLTNFTDILEEQISYKNDSFQIDYDGHENPSTTGDRELDDYVGTEEIDDLEFIANSVSEQYVMEFFKTYRFSLIRRKMTVEGLKNVFSRLKTDEFEMDAFDEFLRLENALKIAHDNNDGDFNKFTVQLRDGHHRVFGAINAGEEYICVNLDKESIKQYEGYYRKL
jgi:hypothetical protein